MKKWKCILTSNNFKSITFFSSDMSERYGARKTMETQGESSASTLRVPTIQNAFVNANQNGPRAMESSKNLRSLGKYFVSFWGRRIESAMSTEIAGIGREVSGLIQAGSKGSAGDKALVSEWLGTLQRSMRGGVPAWITFKVILAAFFQKATTRWSGLIFMRVRITCPRKLPEIGREVSGLIQAGSKGSAGDRALVSGWLGALQRSMRGGMPESHLKSYCFLSTSNHTLVWLNLHAC